jgi:anhydro-N-acetylmuramic acid kinase
MSLYIGLMSGTSMDGVDAALVEFPGNHLIEGLTRPYSNQVKDKIEYIAEGNTFNLSELCQLNILIGREFADAANQLLQHTTYCPVDIEAIGSHGQTVCHEPTGQIPFTLQLGCPHTISSKTGITVVADFRTRDIVNGGQGAPFAPLYHQELFKNDQRNIAVLNIGGIANITLLVNDRPVLGWDVGPGNCLMDAWVKMHLGHDFDKGGHWASQGKVIPELLEQLRQDVFFTLIGPKSIGKEYFSLSWLDRALKTHYTAVDVQTTLLRLTAEAIAHDIHNVENSLTALYICGGGAHNTALCHAIAELLPSMNVTSIAEVGINPDSLEAMMFAWLAWKAIHNEPVDLSTITGSRHPAILGAIYPMHKTVDKLKHLAI